MVADEKSDSRKTIRLRSDFAELGRLNEFIGALAEDEKLDPDTRFSLELCLEEAVTNILMHGAIADKSGAPVSVTVLSTAPELTLCLEDEGIPFDPTSSIVPPAPKSLEDAPIGGLGIPLMRKTARSMTYERRGDRNRLILQFGPAPRAADARASKEPGK
jgi:anti-sigma regulatory factor (Ser/Thr protein kinase)